MPNEERDNGNDILQSAPPGTPAWSLGLGFFLAIIFTNGLTLYLAISPDLRAYFTSKAEVRKQEIETSKELTNRATESILQIVATYSAQVADLSKSVGALQRDKSELEHRVSNLEKDVTSAQEQATICQRQLESCKAQSATVTIK